MKATQIRSTGPATHGAREAKVELRHYLEAEVFRTCEGERYSAVHDEHGVALEVSADVSGRSRPAAEQHAEAGIDAKQRVQPIADADYRRIHRGQSPGGIGVNYDGSPTHVANAEMANHAGVIRVCGRVRGRSGERHSSLSGSRGST